MHNNIMIYRILISISIIMLLLGYLLNIEIIIYLFAIGILFGHALNHWNNSKK